MSTKCPASIDLLGIISPEFLQNPYTVYDKLRCDAPISWNEKRKHWLISTYKEADELLREHRCGMMISKSHGLNPLLKFAAGAKSIRLRMINQDPPDHTRLRGLVNKAFSPSMIVQLRPRIKAIANELIDRVYAAGQMDVVRDYALPLPVTVIAEMLGVPLSDRHKFRKWSQQMIAAAEPPYTPFKILRMMWAQGELVNYLRPLVNERRKHPQKDLISALVEAQDQGQKLTADELLANTVLILVAGHETTVHLIGNTIHQLLMHPEQRALLQEKPELISSAISEVLRFDSPVQFTRRIAYSDMEVGGQTIKKGDMLMIMLGSANRDPAQFANPNDFDIRRSPNKHLAFGAGIHHCLGWALAETEGQIATNVLLQRLPAMKQNCPHLEYKRPFALRGLKSLPITWECGSQISSSLQSAYKQSGAPA